VKLPAYPGYKPSGIEWLGSVPEHWTICPLKYLCRRSALYGANIPAEEYSSDGVRFLRTTDIDDLGQLQSGGVFIERVQAEGYVLSDGDILLSRSGTIGRAFVYSSARHAESAYAGYLVRFVPSGRLNSRFMFYFTKCTPFRDWLDTQVIASTIGNVNGQKYAQCPIPVPKRAEQDGIADFLDRHTTRIDTVVAKDRALMDRLREKRAALISRTVTRGLSPDAARAAGLDPYPKYKPSGTEWLGDLPEHWALNRLKFLLTEPLKYGANEAAEMDDRDLPRYVRITDVDENDSLRDETFRSLPHDVAAPYLLRDGDLLFARSGATAGKTFLYRTRWGACAYAGYLIRARIDRKKGSPEFIRYFTASASYWQWLASAFIQATIQNVSAERYASLWLPVPPLPEQLAIAHFLDRETAKIQRMVATIETAIERLQEYRTALITAAVTGKIDVRESRQNDAK